MYNDYAEKDNNRKKPRRKNIIIWLVVIILLAGGVIYFVLNDTNKYILVNNEAVFRYKDNKIERLSDISNVSPRQRYMMYYEDNHIGNYYINNSMDESEWYFYHKTKKESYTFYTPYIALSNGIDYVKYDKTTLNDNDLIDLKELVGIDDIDESMLSPSYKVYKDLDNDGIDEAIYCVGYRDEEDISRSFSIVYAKKEGIIYNIIRNEGKIIDGEEEFGQYNIVFMIDIDSDYSYELIIEYSDYDISDYFIYNFKNNEFNNMEESE